MTMDNVVITEVLTGALLHGTVPTSVGHNLNREILRLRPDINAVIHVRHDETITLGSPQGDPGAVAGVSLRHAEASARGSALVPFRQASFSFTTTVPSARRQRRSWAGAGRSR